MVLMEKRFTESVSCRLLAPTLGVHMCTCSTRTVSMLRKTLAFSRCRLMGSPPAVSLHLHVLYTHAYWGLKHVHGAMHIDDAAYNYGDSTKIDV